MESNTAYGSPSSTELSALTAVVMSDVAAFQTREEEQQTGKFLRIDWSSSPPNLYAALQGQRLSGLCHGRDNLCID